MYKLYRLIFENLRIVFPVLLIAGVYQIGATCWDTCKMMGYDPAILFGMM